MLQAQLKGKLSIEQENLEDILTSNVFGSLKYLPVQEGLLPFLGNAMSIEGGCLAGYFTNVINADYQFWQWLNMSGCEGCEPDVLIVLCHSDGFKSLVLVEAKYRSGKSSETDEESDVEAIEEETPPKDQLAKEWHNLLALAEEIDAKPLLVYVTADFAIPRKDILESQKELERKGLAPAEIYWLSWRDLKRSMKESTHPIVFDLINLITNRYQLTTFEKLSLGSSLQCSWNFKGIPLKVRWDIQIPKCPWKIDLTEIYKFNWKVFKENSMQWRFES